MVKYITILLRVLFNTSITYLLSISLLPISNNSVSIDLGNKLNAFIILTITTVKIAEKKDLPKLLGIDVNTVLL